MACCCNPPPPCCPIPRTLTNTRVPAIDTFGPFPDETVASSIDRVLHAFGVCAAPFFPNLSMPSPDCTTCSIPSCCDEPPSPCGCSCGSCSTPKVKTCSSSPLRQITVTKTGCCCKPSNSSMCCTKKCVKSCCSSTNSCKETCNTTCTKCPPKKTICRRIVYPKTCCCSNSSSIARAPSKCCSISKASSTQSLLSSKNNNNVACCEVKKPRKPLFRRSFSLCSLACRKLKQKLSAQNDQCDSPKWLWTRMQTLDSGVEVYEVFMRSNVNENPLHVCEGLNPKMIFVTLSNGTIVPFETLGSHK